MSAERENLGDLASLEEDSYKDFIVISAEEEHEKQHICKNARLAMLQEITAWKNDDNTSNEIQALLQTIPTNSYDEFWKYCKKGINEILELINITSCERSNQLAAHVNTYNQVKAELCQANGAWALSLAGKVIRKAHVTSDEQRQEIRAAALLALAKCVEYIDADRGNRITTYSKKTIEGEAWEALLAMQRGCEISRNIRTAARKVKEKIEQAAATGKTLSIDEANKLAKTGEKTELITRAMKAARGKQSLNDSSNEDTRSMIDIIESKEQDVDHKQKVHEELEVVIAKAKPDETEQILLYGLYGVTVSEAKHIPKAVTPNMTLYEIAAALGIRNERIRLIYERLMRKLRRVASNIDN